MRRIFKQTTGKSLSRFILEARISPAAGYLGNRELKITEIAKRMGFDYPYAFSRAYKHVTGTFFRILNMFYFIKGINRHINISWNVKKESLRKGLSISKKI